MQTYNKEEDFAVFRFGLIKINPDLFFIIPNVTLKPYMLYGTSDRDRTITLIWYFGSRVVWKGGRRNWLRMMSNGRLYY